MTLGGGSAQAFDARVERTRCYRGLPGLELSTG
jgi:hypothetical protein